MTEWAGPMPTLMTILGCVTQQHDLRLVVLAALICLLACLTTVTLLGRSMAAAQQRRAAGWLAAAALVFGLGTWSLHFVAMLAYLPDLPVLYDTDLTLLSAGLAVLGAAAALAVWRWCPRSRLQGALGGALLGLAVATMHYTGVAAMRLPGTLALDAGTVALSLLLAAACGAAALARAGEMRGLRGRLAAAGWLALAICGLHFTGMAAIRIELGLDLSADPDLAGDMLGAGKLGSGVLGIAVAATSLIILLGALAATLAEQHLDIRRQRELDRMRALTDMAQEVLLVHHQGTVVEMNSAGTRLLGYAPAEVIGRPLLSLFAEADRPLLRRRQDSGPTLLPVEVSLLASDGRLVPMELSCRRIEFDGLPATAVMMRDLSASKRDEARIRHLALHDALTDLPNRTLLQERLARALQAAGELRRSAAVLFIDLDRFKPINDLLGHAAGDSLLVQVSARLQQGIRGHDTLARVGGDEFVVVLADAGSPGRTSTVAARLVEGLSRAFVVEGREVEIGTSIGVAMYPGDGAEPEALLRAADTALYRAKQQGRGGVRFYEASMDADLRERHTLEHDLRHAVERGELELFYQPLLSCRSGEVEGFEALLRWRHPTRGLLSPDAFIGLAEETGLIRPIGAWVVDAACTAAAAWPRPWWVAVNISPVQFRQDDLVGHIARALGRTGLPPGRLEVEVTEGVLIGDTGQAMRLLSEIRDLGVRLSLDDFGTGYSSLSYLRSFAFDKIKIDRSFVAGLGESREATMIVNAIIALGHSLGLAITAEGVETPQQLAMLQAQGSDEVQGYLIGRPAAVGRFGPLPGWGAPARLPTRLAS